MEPSDLTGLSDYALKQMVGDLREENGRLRQTAELCASEARDGYEKIRRLREESARLEARVAGEHFESVGWQKRAEAAEKRVEELERMVSYVGEVEPT